MCNPMLYQEEDTEINNKIRSNVVYVKGAIHVIHEWYPKIMVYQWVVNKCLYQRGEHLGNAS